LMFLVVVLANIFLPFFIGYNVYVVSFLMFFLVALFFIMYRRKDSLKVKLIKGLILVVPFIFLGFVVYFSFDHVSEANYFYDIGGVEDFKSPYLYPSDRVSLLKEGVGSRNITSSPIYFDVPAEYSKGKVNITLLVRGNFPKNSTILIAGKSPSLDYVNQVMYVSNLSNSSLWRLISAEFNLSDLSSENLTFSIKIPHLEDYRSKNNVISIDWINITESKE